MEPTTLTQPKLSLKQNGLRYVLKSDSNKLKLKIEYIASEMSKTKKFTPKDLKDKYQFTLTEKTNTIDFNKLLLALRQNNILSETDYPLEQVETDPLSTLGREQNPQLEFANLITKFKKHLSELVNPFVFRDIEEFLRDVFDEKQIFSPLSNLPNLYKEHLKNQKVNGDLPTDSLELIENLDRCIKLLVKKDLFKKSEVLKIFEGIANQKENWKEIDYFFQLPMIRMLENETMSSLYKIIMDGKNYRHLDEEIQKYLGPETYENANELIGKTSDYVDMYSLSSQIIKNKPDTTNTLLAHWGKNSEFFKGKSFRFIDPQTKKEYYGFINTSEFRLNGNSMKFTLEEEFELVQSFSIYNFSLEPQKMDNLHIKHFKSIKYSLDKVLFHQHLSENDSIRIENQKTSEPSLIPDGKYVLSSIDEVPSSYRYYTKRHRKITLKNTSTHSEVQIEAYYTTAMQYSKDFESFKIITNKSTKTCSIWDLKKVVVYKDQHAEAWDKLSHKCIKIKEDIDPRHKKLEALREADRQRIEIRNQIKKYPNDMEILLKNLIENHFKTVNVDVEKLQTPNLTKLLLDLSNLYSLQLDEERTPAILLGEIVLEANYDLTVQKERSVTVSKTMELLKNSATHVDNLHNKEGILFLGPTGGGKSTTVLYLQEIPLLVQKRHGDDIYVIDPKHNQTAPQPVIGQSLGSSETLYAQGYSTTSGTHLVDCPGFLETRGIEYELCTSFSIDQTVNSMSKIRALVIVIPYDTFTLDRANPLIERLGSVEERFPEIFTRDKNSSDLNPSYNGLYIFITKSPRTASAEHKEHFENRLRQLLSETEERIKSYSANHISSNSEEANKYHLFRKRDLWSMMLTLFRKKQIKFIDPREKVQRKKLLNKLVNSKPEAQKFSFSPSMHNSDIQDQFNNCVEMSLDTWNKHLFTPFILTIPNAIEENKKKEEDKNKDMDTCKKKILEVESNIKKCRENISKWENLIELSKNKEQELTSHSDWVNFKDERLKQCEQNIDQAKRDLEAERLNNEKFKKEKEEKENEIQKTKIKIEELQSEVIKLSTGSTTEELWSYRKSPKELEQESTIDIVDEALYEQAFSEKNSEINYVLRKEKRILKGWKGELWHTTTLERKYRLISNDPEVRKIFEESLSQETFGNHIAQVKGEHFAYKFGRRVSTDSKQVKYSFKTFWNGKDYPWISVTHITPNVDVNESAIINLNAEIELLEKALPKLNMEITQEEHGFDTKIKTSNKKIESLLDTIQNLNIQKSELTKEIKEKFLEFIHEQKRQEEQQIKNGEQKKKDLEEEILRCQNEIKLLKDEFKSLNLKRRNLAVIIWTQKNVLEPLRRFGQMAIDLAQNRHYISEYSYRVPSEKSQRIRNLCDEFNRIYDEKLKEIILQAEIELGMSSQ